jgi:hypothetical protein
VQVHQGIPLLLPLKYAGSKGCVIFLTKLFAEIFSDEMTEFISKNCYFVNMK